MFVEELVHWVAISIPGPSHVEDLAQKFSRQVIAKLAEELPEPQPTCEKDMHNVDINSLTHGHSRSIGLESIVWSRFKQLGLDVCLKEMGLTPSQIEVASALIIGRLVEPGSERATLYWLKNTSGLDELMNTQFNFLSLNTLYQVGDELLKRKDDLERYLAEKKQGLFSLDRTILLYGLTNTYFEGSSKQITRAKRGRSKEKRSDCPLVSLGLVLDQRGFPLRSQVFDGNVCESHTLQEFIEALDVGGKKPVVVLDAGIASAKNKEWLREQGYSYIVCAKSKKKFSDVELKTVREGREKTVKAALIEQDKNGESTLVCHSLGRELKEQSMRERLEDKLQKELSNLNEGLCKPKRLKQYPKVLERIGKLKAKYAKIAKHYNVQVEKNAEGDKATQVAWTRKEQAIADEASGYYSLKVFGLEWDAGKLWETYVMLTKVEESFRCLKSEPGFRPIYHKTDKRVDGHLFISLLAYHIMQTVQHQLRHKGLSYRWETLRRIMSSQTLVTASLQSDEGKAVHLRSITVASEDQKKIYSALGLSSSPISATKMIAQ